jgi:hypothetical protein
MWIHGWFGLAWFGLVWLGLAWLGLVWFGLVRFGLVRFGLVWFGSVRFGLVWFGSVRFGLVWFGLVRFGFMSSVFLFTPRSTSFKLCGREDVWAFSFNTSQWSVLHIQAAGLCNVSGRLLPSLQLVAMVVIALWGLLFST